MLVVGFHLMYCDGILCFLGGSQLASEASERLSQIMEARSALEFCMQSNGKGTELWNTLEPAPAFDRPSFLEIVELLMVGCPMAYGWLLACHSGMGDRMEHYFIPEI